MAYQMLRNWHCYLKRQWYVTLSYLPVVPLSSYLCSLVDIHKVVQQLASSYFLSGIGFIILTLRLSIISSFVCLHFGQFIFEKDLKQCPTFHNLKTLLLNDHWCVAPNFLALTCILKHSPVLEKLKLEHNSRVCKCF